MGTDRRVFHLLDGIRGLAALLVVQRHNVELFDNHEWGPSFLAVDLFFILSGFVVAHSYERRLQSEMSWGMFMAVRVIRLYPLYFLATFIGSFSWYIRLHNAGIYTTSRFVTDVVSCLLMLLNLGPPVVWDPRWSLTFEMLVNMLYAGIVHHLRDDVLVGICGLGALILPYTLVAQETMDIGWDINDWYIGVARVVWGFFVGVALLRIHDGKVAWRSIFVLACAAGSGTALAFAWTGGPTRDIALVLVVLPLVVYAAALPEVNRPVIVACNFLGSLSYVIYVLHSPVRDIIWHTLGITHVIPAPQIGFIYLGILVPFCLAADAYYDVPVRRRLTLWLKRYTASRYAPVSTEVQEPIELQSNTASERV